MEQLIPIEKIGCEQKTHTWKKREREREREYLVAERGKEFMKWSVGG